MRYGWSTPTRSENSPQPLLSLTKSSQPKSFTSCASLAIYSPILPGIAFRWEWRKVAQALFLQGVVIASPHSTSGRGGVWNITRVGWGGTRNKRFALLPTCHTPLTSSLEGAATAIASNLRVETWGVAATLRGLGVSPPPLACMYMRLGPRRQSHLLPSPPPPYPKMTLTAHAMRDWYHPGGYGTLSPSPLNLELHIPLMC